MSSFQLALSAEGTAALGGFIKELSQSPLFSDRWSQADFIDWRITLTDIVRVCFCFFCWENVGWEFESLFLQNASQSRVRRCFMFVPRDMPERMFSRLLCVARRLSQVSKFHKVPTQ